MPKYLSKSAHDYKVYNNYEVYNFREVYAVYTTTEYEAE